MYERDIDDPRDEPTEDELMELDAWWARVGDEYADQQEVESIR